MVDQRSDISPREQMLLEELEQLLEEARRTALIIDGFKQRDAKREQEAVALRRSMIELKEENQHLREVLQTWRQRLDGVLSQLKAIN